MENLEKEVLELLEKQPTRNPDGGLWRIKIRGRLYTKAEILDRWAEDEKLRCAVVKLLLGLKLHLAGRRRS